MRFGTAAPKPKRVQAEKVSVKSAAAAQQAADRKLVEDYWRSVIVSKGEPPLYHTFSDRYGGTRGIPFAARTDCSAVLKVPPKPDIQDINACLVSGNAALKEGRVDVAQDYFHEALTLLQNQHGGLTVTELVKKNDSHGTSLQLAEVLRGLAEVEILYRRYEKAVQLLDLCSTANPLKSETYILRASCYERLGEPKTAYEEFEKYLKMNTPSLDVLAHTGKCAAEAGLIDEAEYRLRQLLEIAEQLELEDRTAQEDGSVSQVERYLYLFKTVPMYIAHANFYLGYIRERKAHTLPDEPGIRDLLADAKPYFTKAVSSAEYVACYERNVALAIEHKEYAVAKELLQNLQMMKPDCADYFTSMAEVNRMTKDLQGEILALSEALDRHQTLTEQRRSRLARGCIFYEIQDYDNALMDFSIAISLPCDNAKDRFTPTAYLKRAETYQQRQLIAKHPAQAREDQEAALSDYSHFLDAVDELGVDPNEDNAACQKDVSIRGFACDPSSVTSAMLVLANGAFQRRNHVEATKFFSSAIARGWEPIRPSAKKKAAQLATSSDAASKNFLEESLFDQMYISLAHTVIAEHHIHDDMFKIPYESREWVVQQDMKKGKASERKDQEKPTFAFPSLAYATVDCRYNALRALEPTMYSALEEMFLELWEPYHNEVERTREDVMSARGKRGKRHGG